MSVLPVMLLIPIIGALVLAFYGGRNWAPHLNSAFSFATGLARSLGQVRVDQRHVGQSRGSASHRYPCVGSAPLRAGKARQRASVEARAHHPRGREVPNLVA